MSARYESDVPDVVEHRARQPLLLAGELLGALVVDGSQMDMARFSIENLAVARCVVDLESIYKLNRNTPAC